MIDAPALTAQPAPPSGAATPDVSSTPESTTPLDQAPLSEYVARRAKGEIGQPAPVATEEAPADDVGDERQPAPPDDPRKPRQGRFQERLGLLTRQRHDAERALESERQRAARLESELQAFKQSQQQPPADQAAQAPVGDGKAPNLDQYLAAGKTYEDWMVSLIRYENTQTLEAERKRFQQEQRQQEFQTQVGGFGERTEAAKAKYPDYADVVMTNERVKLSPVMQDIAVRSQHGPDIMYWLGTHEAEANQLGQLTASYPAAAFPLVEAHLLLLSGHRPGNGAPGAKKAVPVSSAPAPISPVGGGTTTQPVPLDQVPLGEFVRRRNAELTRKKG